MNDFEYRPLSELPHDADPTADRPSKYTYGTDVFGGSNDWIIVENNTNPVRVYKLPVPVSRILNSLSVEWRRQGADEARDTIRRALGIK